MFWPVGKSKWGPAALLHDRGAAAGRWFCPSTSAKSTGWCWPLPPELWRIWNAWACPVRSRILYEPNSLYSLETQMLQTKKKWYCYSKQSRLDKRWAQKKSASFLQAHESLTLLNSQSCFILAHVVCCTNGLSSLSRTTASPLFLFQFDHHSSHDGLDFNDLPHLRFIKPVLKKLCLSMKLIWKRSIHEVTWKDIPPYGISKRLWFFPSSSLPEASWDEGGATDSYLVSCPQFLRNRKPGIDTFSSGRIWNQSVGKTNYGVCGRTCVETRQRECDKHIHSGGFWLSRQGCSHVSGRQGKLCPERQWLMQFYIVANSG